EKIKEKTLDFCKNQTIRKAILDSGVDILEVDTLESAVIRAAELSCSGDVVLLSPACASFDQFSNFEARGEAFESIICSWIKSRP
ncbi:MAG: hypothetical protein RL124_901, partial [Acidobacteriota bacterium]